MARRPLVSFRWEHTGLITTVRKMPERVDRAVKEVIRRHIDRVFNIVRFSTPTDTGRALRAWRIEMRDGGRAGVVTNDTPYINVLEYGGYPVRPARGPMPSGAFQRGNAYLGGHPPGPRTMGAPGGEPTMRSNVSKQAPHGMVRKALGETEDAFQFDLEEAIERAWNGEGI